MINPSFARLAALGLVLALPVAANAQPASTAAPQAGTPPIGSMPGAQHRERAAMTPQQRAQHVETHLTRLRTQLAITPAQQTQWEGYAKTTRDNATELYERFQQRETQFASISAADNMADYATISELHAVQLRRLAVSFQALYGTLSPEQKGRADTAFRSQRTPGTAPR